MNFMACFERKFDEQTFHLIDSATIDEVNEYDFDSGGRNPILNDIVVSSVNFTENGDDSINS